MTFRRAAAPRPRCPARDHSHRRYDVRQTTSRPARPQLEKLDRGLVATTTSEGVFLSWRLLGKEATSRTDHGLAGTDFAVYRDGKRLATVTDSTNYLDKAGTPTSRYRVVSLVNGRERDRSDYATPWSGGYRELPLRKPADGVTPAGEAYTYSANDMSVGDVDGDGEYEYVVLWNPSNSKDVSQIGYTGNVYIDTYKADGRLLHRLDLGVNIRAGAHYTQFLVYDFDGDGRSEMMLKTAPGTKTTRYAKSGEVRSERYITMPAADRRAGYSNQDDYRVSKAGYYDHLVDHVPAVAGPARGEERTVARDAGGRLRHRPAVPVPAEPRGRRGARRLLHGRLRARPGARATCSATSRASSSAGPEYLTVFDGLTGRELQTTHYEPGRTDDGLRWGDYAMARIEPGNRVDRFLAGVAYLDGKRPSAVFARGYYTRTTLATYGWNGKRITKGWVGRQRLDPDDEPLQRRPARPGRYRPEYGSITTQGFHSLSAADVDGDGKQEIVYGSATIDDDGSLLYSSKDVMPPGSADPGEIARLGHGDAMHVTDIDPQRPGQEIFTVHEGGTYAPYGYALREAATGKVIYGEYSGKDTGRGMIGDIVPEEPGLETWAMRLRSADGDALGTTYPGTNASIRWAADMTTQIVDGASTSPRPSRTGAAARC